MLRKKNCSYNTKEKGEKKILYHTTKNSKKFCISIYFFQRARPELVEGFERSILQQVQDERKDKTN